MLQDKAFKVFSMKLFCLTFCLNLSYFKCPTEGISINSLFPRPPHFSKFKLILLSVKTQLTSDNKFFKYITPLTSILEVLTLSLSNIGYKDGSICGLSCDVDVDEDEDVAADVDLEQLEEVFLKVVGTDTHSFSDKFIFL